MSCTKCKKVETLMSTRVIVVIYSHAPGSDPGGGPLSQKKKRKKREIKKERKKRERKKGERGREKGKKEEGEEKGKLCIPIIGRKQRKF